MFWTIERATEWWQLLMVLAGVLGILAYIAMQGIAYEWVEKGPNPRARRNVAGEMIEERILDREPRSWRIRIIGWTIELAILAALPQPMLIAAGIGIAVAAAIHTVSRSVDTTIGGGGS